MKGWLETIGGVERRGEHRLHFANRDFVAADHRHGMAENDGAVVGPDIEVAEPEIFVDTRGEALRFGKPGRRRLQVEAEREQKRGEFNAVAEIADRFTPRG